MTPTLSADDADANPSARVSKRKDRSSTTAICEAYVSKHPRSPSARGQGNSSQGRTTTQLTSSIFSSDCGGRNRNTDASPARAPLMSPRRPLPCSVAQNTSACGRDGRYDTSRKRKHFSQARQSTENGVPSISSPVGRWNPSDTALSPDLCIQGLSLNSPVKESLLTPGFYSHSPLRSSPSSGFAAFRKTPSPNRSLASSDEKQLSVLSTPSLALSSKTPPTVSSSPRQVPVTVLSKNSRGGSSERKDSTVLSFSSSLMGEPNILASDKQSLLRPREPPDENLLKHSCLRKDAHPSLIPMSSKSGGNQSDSREGGTLPNRKMSFKLSPRRPFPMRSKVSVCKTTRSDLCSKPSVQVSHFNSTVKSRIESPKQLDESFKRSPHQANDEVLTNVTFEAWSEKELKSSQKQFENGKSLKSPQEKRRENSSSADVGRVETGLLPPNPGNTQNSLESSTQSPPGLPKSVTLRKREGEGSQSSPSTESNARSRPFGTKAKTTSLLSPSLSGNSFHKMFEKNAVKTRENDGDDSVCSDISDACDDDDDDEFFLDIPTIDSRPSGAALRIPYKALHSENRSRERGSPEIVANYGTSDRAGYRMLLPKNESYISEPSLSDTEAGLKGTVHGRPSSSDSSSRLSSTLRTMGASDHPPLPSTKSSNSLGLAIDEMAPRDEGGRDLFTPPSNGRPEDQITLSPPPLEGKHTEAQMTECPGSGVSASSARSLFFTKADQSSIHRAIMEMEDTNQIPIQCCESPMRQST